MTGPLTLVQMVASQHDRSVTLSQLDEPKPVLEVLPHWSFSGRPPHDIDFRICVDRTQQRRAIAAHASQAVPASPVWRRIELMGAYESLRWLLPRG